MSSGDDDHGAQDIELQERATLLGGGVANKRRADQLRRGSLKNKLATDARCALVVALAVALALIASISMVTIKPAQLAGPTAERVLKAERDRAAPKPAAPESPPAPLPAPSSPPPTRTTPSDSYRGTEIDGAQIDRAWEAYARGRDACLKSSANRVEDGTMFTHRTRKSALVQRKSQTVVDRVTWTTDPWVPAKRRSTRVPTDELRNMTLASCYWQDSNGGTEWRTQRVGPFVSRGGEAWMQFGWASILDLDSVPDLRLGQIFLGPTDEAGEPIGFPPLHIHHWHVVPAWARDVSSSMHTVVAQAHGDSQCRQAQGGARCLLQSPPEGRDLGPVSLGGGEYDTDGDIIDVRPAGSPPLTFYIEIAAQLLPGSAAAPLQLLSNGNPFRFDATTQSFAQLYFLPAAEPPTPPEPHVLWFSSRFLGTGKYLSAYLHSHQEWMEEVLVVAAPPEDMGLNSPPFELELPWQPLALSELNLSKEGFVEHVKTALERAGRGSDAIKCWYRPEIEGSAADAGSAAGRRMAGCRGLDGRSNLPLQFKRGDVLTIVALGLNEEEHEVGMHTIFRGLVEWDELADDRFYARNKQKFNGLYVFGATDPDYQLHHEGFPISWDETEEAGGSPLSKGVRANLAHSDYATFVKALKTPTGNRFEPRRKFDVLDSMHRSSG